MTDKPVPGANTQAGIAPASPGWGVGDSPYYIYRQIGESRSFPEAEALARESADWDRIEIRSGCGELVAVLNRGKWTSTLAGKRPTYDGGKA